MIEIIILIFLIILNAFFAASEMALISLNDNKVRNMAEGGNKRAILLYKLLKEPSRFLATIQIGITLAGFMASAFAAESFASEITQFIVVTGVPIPEKVIETFSVIMVTVLLSYFTLVFGELVPKRLAMKQAEAISMFVAQPLTILSVITSPFVKLLTVSMNIVVRLFGQDPHADNEKVTEEEIRMMVDIGEEFGTIRDAERMMINNIFEFDNKVVSDIMTHRTHIIGIPVEASAEEVIRIISSKKYSRIPVYDKDIDKIAGILHVKDFIPFLQAKESIKFDLKLMVREPFFVSEAKPVNVVFKELQKNKIQMAVVMDEYGGTAGIVTMEDLLEEIVGNIFDEYDDEEADVVILDESTFMMVGHINLDEVEEFLNMELQTEEYRTLSGFLIGQLGRIPDVNEQAVLKLEGVVFKVEEVDDKKILKVKVCKSL